MKKTLVNIRKIKNGQEIFCEDIVALETEYSLFVNGQRLLGLSCTPENLKELALGRLYTEGLVKKISQVKSVQLQEEKQEIHVEISDNGNSGSETEINRDNEVESQINSQIFSAAEEFFSQPGELFRETGCAHSCAFWKEIETVCSFEDIGRHNALDKVAGKLLMEEINPEEGVIFTSGRISADYLKKIIQMGATAVVSRAAVTEAAVRLAEKHGILLLGFVRNNTGNLYAGQL